MQMAKVRCRLSRFLAQHHRLRVDQPEGVDHHLRPQGQARQILAAATPVIKWSEKAGAVASQPVQTCNSAGPADLATRLISSTAAIPGRIKYRYVRNSCTWCEA